MKFFMQGSYLPATAVELVSKEKVLPPDLGPRSSTENTVAIAAGLTRSTPPDNYYLRANPRLAGAPESGTSVLCTGQGAFGHHVNYILTPIYPEHVTLLELDLPGRRISRSKSFHEQEIPAMGTSRARSVQEPELLGAEPRPPTKFDLDLDPRYLARVQTPRHLVKSPGPPSPGTWHKLQAPRHLARAPGPLSPGQESRTPVTRHLARAPGPPSPGQNSRPSPGLSRPAPFIIVSTH